MGRHLFRRKDVILAAALVLAAGLSAQTAEAPQTAPAAQSAQQQTQASQQQTAAPQNASASQTASAPQTAAAPQTDSSARPARIPFDIPVPATGYAQTMINKYRAEFLTNFGRKWLAQTLDDGETYRLYVRRELKKRNMPASLEYLPVVESEYNPLAKSRSGAAGLWQFMTNSIAPFLKKNGMIDERYDPWKSTDAALTKLQANYKMFGDWPLAIAAYNCGAGAMQRILNSADEKTFWYIAEHNLLRDQSVQYVPKFLAISDLASNGPYYNIALPEISKTTRFAEFDSVTVTGTVTLSRLASELRIDENTLRTLNPALIQFCTPGNAPYELRLPSGMKDAAITALSEIEHPSGGRNIAIHHIAKGETLWSLARASGCSVAELCELNGITQSEVLSIGRILYLPIPVNTAQ